MLTALTSALVLSAAPTGPATKLVAIWLDHGSPYMELRPDGSGRIGINENNWTVEKDQIHIVTRETQDTFDLPFTLIDGGKKLQLVVQGTTVELERSKQKPAAKAPPPPKPPSQLDAPPDAGTPAKKKKGKK